MNSAQFQRVSELVLAALDLDPGQRDAFLQAECGNDAELLNEAHSLLAMEHADAPIDLSAGLERPPAPVGVDDIYIDQFPRQFGRYTITRLIGTGGMGIVYEAKQANPKRTVALKLIRPGLMTPIMVVRLHHEARMLGQLNHPGIAHIYEAGTAQRWVHSTKGNGVPFIAMEFVAGETITGFARRSSLTTEARLHLLLRVCRALEHAHQKGVIHRDLKPGNILVTADGQPKVLDFGIARSTEADLQVTTMPTESGRLLGTLPYMSPEQVAGDPSAIDTRSDVYALGVIGYELLVRRLPIPVVGMPITEAILAIRDREPAPLGAIDSSLRGDLQLIFEHALEKDSNRRYQSAADFAADLQRHLDDRPILARRASTMYQLSKFAKRNKALVGGSVATVLALTIGLIATTMAMSQATRQRNAAVVSAARAKTEAAKAQAVNDFLKEMLGSVSPARARGEQISVRNVLDRAAAKLDEGALRDQPEVRAAVHITIGNTYGALGAYDDAGRHLRAGLEGYRGVLEIPHKELAQALDALALLLQAQGAFDDAEPLFTEALAMRRELFGEASVQVADSVHNLASLVHHRGDYDQAEELYRRALAIRRNLLGADQVGEAKIMFDLAALLQHQGALTEAEPFYRGALAINRRALGNDHPDVARALTGFGRLRRAQGDPAGAEAMYRDALAIARKVYPKEHPALAIILNNLAVLLRVEGDYAGAEPLQREALSMQRALLGDDHPTVAYSLSNLGHIVGGMGKHVEAEHLFRKALATRRKISAGDHPTVAESLGDLASVLRAKGQHVEAERLYREALDIQRKRLPQGHRKIADSLGLIGNELVEQGRFKEAEALLMSSYASLKDHPNAPAHSKRNARERLLKLYEAWDKPEKAAEWRTKSTSDAMPISAQDP